MAEAREVTIDRLGLQGDGLADTDGGTVVAPFALPGERVRLAQGRAPEIIGAASTERQPAPCPHFTLCGGCVAQHMAPPLYRAWKRGIVVGAFAQLGIAPEIAPLTIIAPGTRRRAVLTARRTRGAVLLGYHARRSDTLIDLAECPVLSPAIVAAFGGLRALAGLEFGLDELRLTVLATAHGLDIAIEALPRGARDPALRARIAAVAAEHGFARVSVGGDVVVTRAEPSLAIAGVDVVPPPGVFLQAVVEAEAVLAQLVIDATKTAKHVADLFSGAGTFSLALAKRSRVLAIDSDRASLAALETAARKAQGLKPIATKTRDLFREPLGWQELKAFDAVVLDPPRAGAKAQAEELAKSKVPVVVAVSCNPATLARDAQSLLGGGYKLARVTPIDQFLWSHHVETVAVFRRPS